MKKSLIPAGIIFAAIGAVGAGETVCTPLAVRTTVELNVERSGSEFSLADLLAGPVCPEMFEAASRVRMGQVPRAGIARVIAGGEIRGLIRRLAETSPGAGLGEGIEWMGAAVPERITVRRVGSPGSPHTPAAHPLPARSPAPRSDPEPALVRPGQTVSLAWSEAGIRLLAPVVCLDRGKLGQTVRARLPRSGQVVPAVVVGAGQLRAVS